MEKRYNITAFYFMICCVLLAVYSLYSQIAHTWQVAPPVYMLLVLSILSFALGVFGLKGARSWQSITRGWVTIILSALLCIALTLTSLFVILASSFGANDLIKTAQSPDGRYTIDFYYVDAGAAGSFGIRGERNGPLWFSKDIFYEKHAEEVDVEWINNTTISINNHILNLKKGETYGYK